LILSAGLSSLNLRDAQPFAPPLRQETPSQREAPPAQQEPAPAEPFSPLVGSVFLLLVGISLIFFITSREFRQLVFQRLRWLTGILVFLLILVYALRDHVLPETQEEGGQGGSQNGLQFSGEFPAEPALWFSLLLTFLVSLLLLSLLWRSFQKERQDGSLERLSASAGAALSALDAGAGYRSAILRCYAEMQHTVREQHGLERKASLTPREFQAALRDAGLPPGPVEDITRLFEAARYGNSEGSQEETERARACLQQISQAARHSPASPARSRRPA
jgi:hypothetical protein